MFNSVASAYHLRNKYGYLAFFYLLLFKSVWQFNNIMSETMFLLLTTYFDLI